MRRLLTIIGLEVYAVFLAIHQLSIGVRTDEAKYLLNIPYPHPPFARFIISLFDGWQYHEIAWRIIFATLVIQSVWFFYDLVKHEKRSLQIAIMGSWLLSSAVILQSGTVMMAVLTALQAVVLIWVFLRRESAEPHVVALFWLTSLFTAYQAVLFGPLVLAIFLRSRIGIARSLLLVGAPVFLLFLYTLINPFVPASMFNHVEKDATETLLQHTVGAMQLWLLGGSIVLSIVGTIGLCIRPKAGLLLSIILIFSYVFLSRYDYYAILFTPFFVAGTLLFLRRFPLYASMFLLSMPFGLASVLWYMPPSPTSGVAQVFAAIEEHSKNPSVSQDVIFISGSFGHDWQYRTKRTVLRYQPDAIDTAYAVICLHSCEEMNQQAAWQRLDDVPVEVWMRQ